MYYQQARPSAPDDTPEAACLWNWRILEKAEDAFGRALATPRDSWPPGAYVDVRAHLGLGRVGYWRGFCLEDGDRYWEVAAEHLLYVVERYSALPEDEKPRIRTEAALAHTDLGQMALTRADEALGELGAMNTTAAAQLDEAVRQLQPAIALADQADDETRELAIDVMSALLTAYCLAGRRAEASETLGDFSARWTDGASVRATIVDALQPSVRRGCIDG